MFDDSAHDVMDAIASETSGAPGVARFRVILVGRTGLDAALRLDEAIDLRRVRTAVEAVGELSDPDDAAADDPVAVVVGADADPGPRAASFVDGLRLINPDVRVLLAGGNGAAVRPPFDGTVSGERPAQQIRAILRSPPPPPPPPPRPRRSPSPRPPPGPSPPPPPPPPSPRRPRPRSPSTPRSRRMRPPSPPDRTTSRSSRRCSPGATSSCPRWR